MPILVTGCAGFIASNLCHYLCTLGEQIIGVDALLTGSNLQNLMGLPESSFKFLPLDLREEDAVIDLFKVYSFSHIYHLAAMTHVDRSFVEGRLFWECNVLGTANLFRAATAFGRVEKIINQITDEVIGSSYVAQGDDAPFRPANPYAGSKAAQYFAGTVMYYSYGLPIISTFPCNTYGPRQWPEKIIPKFVLRLLRDRHVPLMITNAKRDWLHVEDHVKALVLLMKKGVVGQRYNIAAKHLITNRELTEHLLFLLGKGPEYIDIVPDRISHDLQYLLDCEGVYSLGWRPTIPFEEGIKDVVEWYIANQDYYPSTL